MISRERVRRILNHSIPDRIAIDMGGCNCTGITGIAYNRLRKKLGINSSPSRMYDFNMQLCYPDNTVLESLHVDVIDAGQAFLKNKDDWKEFRLNKNQIFLIPRYLNVSSDIKGNIYLEDENGLKIGVKPRTSLYVDQCYWPWGNLDGIPDLINIEELFKYNWGVPLPPYHLNIFDDSQYKIFVNGIKDLFNNTQYSIFLTVWCGIIEVGYFLRGFDKFLCDIYLNRSKVFKLLDKLTDYYMRLIKKTIDGVGSYVDIIGFGDDFSGEDGMFIPVKMFNEVFIPYYKIMWDYIHENSDCKVFFHSCGSLFDAIPSLIDAGMDILNPVQVTARNMRPEILKKEFGKNLVFWGGGVDTRRTLPSKTRKDIMQEVKEMVEAFGMDGGYIFNPIHNIQPDVSPENIIACFEAAYQYGFY